MDRSLGTLGGAGVDAAPSATRAGAPDVPWPAVVRLVRAQVRSLVGPRGELDDLTQVALERVVRGMATFEARSQLSTYTYRVCVRVVLNHWRSWRRFTRWFDRATDAGEGVAAPGVEPSAGMEERERAARLRAALDRLAPAKRVVLVLSDLEELPASEIATILECPEATVRSRLRQARLELTERLRRDPYFGEGAP